MTLAEAQAHLKTRAATFCDTGRLGWCLYDVTAVQVVLAALVPANKETAE